MNTGLNLCNDQEIMFGAGVFQVLLVQFLMTDGFRQQLSVQIEPGKEECYHQTLEVGDTIMVEYQVLDSTGQYSRLDIDFRLMQPDGLPVVIEYRRSENSHEFAGGKLKTGDYKFCFDNKFSLFSTKLVYFDVEVMNEDKDADPEPSQDNLGLGLEEYQTAADQIWMQIYYMKQKMLKASNLQTHMTISHGKDMNLVDRNIRRIDNTSVVLVVLIVMAGYLQAYMIKQMFTVKL